MATHLIVKDKTLKHRGIENLIDKQLKIIRSFKNLEGKITYEVVTPSCGSRFFVEGQVKKFLDVSPLT